jgi:beta-glucanase (GH16 family)
MMRFMHSLAGIVGKSGQPRKSIAGKTAKSRTSGGRAVMEAIEPRLLLSGTYHLSFDDEFNSLQLASGAGTAGWLPTDYWNNHWLPGNGEQQYYGNPATDDYNPFSVSNGVLTITAKPTPAGVDADGQPYVSGEISTSHGAPYPQDPQGAGFSQQYGYFEIRAKLPAGKGLWPAFWMMPANGGQAAEYDVFETLGQTPSDIYQSTHWDSYSGGTGYDYQNHINSSDGFHTYGFLWDANNVSWYVDGQLAHTEANHSNTPMYMIVNLAVGGYWPGNPDGTTPFPADMQVDSVRVFSSDPNVPTVSPQSGYDGTLPGAIAPPAAPTGVAASAPNSGQINLSWNAVAGATSYNIYRSTTPGGEGATPYRTGITSNSFADTGLLGNSTYYYKVATVNTLGTSGLSAEAHATTPAAATAPLIDFSDLGGSDYGVISSNYQPGSLIGTGITTTWSGASRYGANSYDGYDHTYGVASSSSHNIGAGGANPFHVDFNSAVTIPSIWVTDWESWHENVTLNGYTNTTDSTPAVSITLTEADIPSHSAGHLSNKWVEVTGLAGVSIKRLELVGTTTAPATNPARPQIDDITILPAALPVQVTGLLATDVDDSKIDLGWNAVSGATSYTIYRSTTPGGEGSTPYRTGLTSTSFEDTGLNSSTSYYYKVAAVNATGTGSQSAEASATTEASTATAALIDFSDLGGSDYGGISGSYQPAALAGSGLSLTWSGASRYGGHSYDGYDHTYGVASSSSKDIGAPGAGAFHVDFSAPVTIPSLWASDWDWWHESVIINGYANSTDSTPAVTVTLTDADIPSHNTGVTSNAWVQVTGLAGVAIQRLEFVGLSGSGQSNPARPMVDDISVLAAAGGMQSQNLVLAGSTVFAGAEDASAPSSSSLKVDAAAPRGGWMYGNSIASVPLLAGHRQNWLDRQTPSGTVWYDGGMLLAPHDDLLINGPVDSGSATAWLSGPGANHRADRPAIYV